MLVFCYNIGDFYGGFIAYLLKYIGIGTPPEILAHPLLKSKDVFSFALSPSKSVLSIGLITSLGVDPL